MAAERRGCGTPEQRAGRVLGIALQGEHIGVAVHDPGPSRDKQGGRVQFEVGFHAPMASAAAEQAHALHPVGLGPLP